MAPESEKGRKGCPLHNAQPGHSVSIPLDTLRSRDVVTPLLTPLPNSVAVITAVRTWWKATPLMHVHDEWYMWRDAVSEIW